MKKKLIWKAQALLLATCVTLSSFHMSVDATKASAGSIEIQELGNLSSSALFDTIGITGTSGTTDASEATDSAGTTDSSGTNNSTGTTDGSGTNDSTGTTEGSGINNSTGTTDGSGTNNSAGATDGSGTSNSAGTTESTKTNDSTETTTDESGTKDSTGTTDGTGTTNSEASTDTVGQTPTDSQVSATTDVNITETQDANTQTIDASVQAITGEQQEAETSSRTMGYQSNDIVIPTLYDGTYQPSAMGTLPASYDSRSYGFITPVRDQGIWGSCWSFSAIGMAEANLVKKGLAGNNLDLSELQLAYFFYHTVADPLGNTAGDSTKALQYSYLQQGGNSAFTTFALAGWTGAADESIAPYTNATSEGYALDNSLAYSDTYHMQNAYWVNMKTDISEVKSLIMSYGAVSASYYSDQGGVDGNNTTTYYNSVNKAYYYKGDYQSNHAIVIVGWDDNFSNSNFNAGVRPTNNGAWLVKNSWGTKFGDNGYFWISYEDAAFNDTDYSTAYAFDFEAGDNYDHNYQYDGASGANAYAVYNGGSIANVFTAKANSSGAAEQINAVSFALYDVNVDYSIQIYKNLKNGQDPTSGTALLSVPKTGRTSYVGYYTVPLEESIIVGEGNTFSVVVTLSRSGGKFAYYFCDYTYTNSGWIGFTNSMQSGQSFSKMSGTDSWKDLSASNMTPRIKAFTTDVAAVMPTSISLSNSSLSLKAGETATLTASFEPSATTETGIIWSSSNDAVATVDANGLVTVMGIGSANIIATTSNGLTAACQVTGNIGKVSGLTAQSQSTNSIKLGWTKQSGVKGYEIYRYNQETKKYEKIATNTKDSKITYNDKSKEVATTYKYKVRAYTKVNRKTVYGAYSAVLETSTKTATPTLTGEALSKGAKLIWEQIDGASGYEVYMSTNKSSGYSLIKTVTKKKTVTYSKKGLSSKTKYYFKIRAYKKVAGVPIYSGYSKVITVKTK